MKMDTIGYLIIIIIGIQFFLAMDVSHKTLYILYVLRGMEFQMLILLVLVFRKKEESR